MLKIFSKKVALGMNGEFNFIMNLYVFMLCSAVILFVSFS